MVRQTSSPARTGTTWRPPTEQATAVLNQAAPVQNTWYTILAATADCELFFVNIRVDTTGEDLQARITLDGVTYTSGSQLCAAGTNYFVWTSGLATGVGSATISGSENNAGLRQAPSRRSIIVEVRKTSNNGAGNLRGAAFYGVHTNP